jgi:hypothetical protein
MLLSRKRAGQVGNKVSLNLVKRRGLVSEGNLVYPSPSLSFDFVDGVLFLIKICNCAWVLFYSCFQLSALFPIPRLHVFMWHMCVPGAGTKGPGIGEGWSLG